MSIIRAVEDTDSYCVGIERDTNVWTTRRGSFVAEHDTGTLCGYCSYDRYFSYRHRNDLEEIAGEQSAYVPPA